MFLVRQTNQHMLFTGKHRYINAKFAFSGISYETEILCSSEQDLKQVMQYERQGFEKTTY